MRPAGIAIAFSAACGRLHFADHMPGDAGEADATGDALVDGALDTTLDGAPDAPNACVGGDHTCLVSCVASDPDCMTTCGDGKCVGNAGELCMNCGADCKTTAPVCGNGACDPGEAPDCVADCGPVPWQWTTQEQMLVTLINMHRSQGVTCPGSTLKTAPVLAVDATLAPAAHEWAWEIAHQNFIPMGTTTSCNGRTTAQREMTGGFNAWVEETGTADFTSAVNAWLADATLCPIVMTTLDTKINAGVATGQINSFVVVLR